MHKILLVDDDPGLLCGMGRVLKKAGFDVLETTDGRHAIELLRDTHLDLSIVDIFMPGVDGMEFIIRVKRHNPDAKIVAISGGGALEKCNVLEIARACGAIRTLTKPFELADLLKTVKEVLNLQNSTHGAEYSSQAAGECNR